MPLTTSQVEDVFSFREQNVKVLLSNILNLNLQYEANEKVIVNTINTLLSNAKSRREGLEYLNLLINNCSPSVLAENALNWTNHCIVKYPDDMLRELRLRVLGVIVELAHTDSEFNKKFVSEHMSKIFETCITTSFVNIYECKTALETLTICMKYYPSWFGSHQDKIEKYLVTLLDNDNEDLILNAAKAFHYLQQTGGAGTSGVNHKANFTKSFHKLCRTTHKLFDEWFKNEKELFSSDELSEDTFDFYDDPTHTTQTQMNINFRRISNILKYAEAMIKNKFPAVKETDPKELLDIIIRGLSFHKCITSKESESLTTHHFSILLSQIQCILLRLLRLYIIWYQTSILPFSYAISKLIIESIELSQKCDCFKIDSLYQECAYKALSEWLSISKSYLHSQFQSQLLVCILKDITPVKYQVTLTISEPNIGKKSQKAKRKAMADRIISSGNRNNSSSLTHFEKNSQENTCRFALKTLQKLLECTELNVKSTLLQDLYKSIFESLTALQTSKPIHPYTNILCQVHLYEVLIALYRQDTLTLLPPLQTSLDILVSGSSSNNKLVAGVCEKGLGILEVLCQPICPSLYLGANKEDEINKGGETLPTRDSIEIHEMVIEESSAIDQSSENQEDEQPHTSNAGNEKVYYDVKLTETDHSTIDDGISEKDANLSDVQFEEISSDLKNDSVENEGTSDERTVLRPKVTAPSEDGNETIEIGDEICEDINKDQTSVGLDESTEKERLDSSSQEPVIEENTNNAEDKIESPLPEENCSPDLFSEPRTAQINEEKSSEPINTEVISEILHTAQINEEKSSEPINTEAISEILHKGDQENADEGKPKNGKNTAETHGEDEPPAKKAKIDEDEGMGDVFIEESKDKSEDLDSSFLQEDSFVDEVKEY
ncbi:uncharacterized protein LOC115888988 isoform X2 [Sitophilus oryzae]|uniref:Uncharacterized protein LOC115888988 isoform X2 n=1 Tax=Sitophilus oryzae TaxID=7048 RepID=A0A6J2YPP4_SITOR|nr:uncharacterized protein LOC115888988 isoform X2 [Sitophilus oryzae]